MRKAGSFPPLFIHLATRLYLVWSFNVGCGTLPIECILLTMVAPKNTAYAEESAEVEVLYANLEKLKLLTKKIQGSLVRLETGGNVVKHAIGPIYSNTQSLQITNNNIDKVNEAIDRLRQPLDAKNREEDIIRSG